jgi:hypothetical protein
MVTVINAMPHAHKNPEQTAEQNRFLPTDWQKKYSFYRKWLNEPEQVS